MASLKYPPEYFARAARRYRQRKRQGVPTRRYHRRASGIASKSV